jgi:hypothetical protein
MHNVIMKTERLIAIQTNTYLAGITKVTDRDFDLLRARAWERSIWAMRIQRVRDITVTAMAITLGGVAGWLLLR